MHVCILTKDRVFDIGYGGEGKFSYSFADWLVQRGVDVTLMGSRIINIQTKRLNKDSINEIHTKIKSNQESAAKIVYPSYPIFALSRLFLSLLWFIKILWIHSYSQISLIHAQDTGYAGLAAVISGKILGVPVVITSHGTRLEVLDSIMCGSLKKLILKFERALDLLVIRLADRIIVVNSSIKNYYSQKTSKRVDFIPVAIKVANFEFSQENRNLIRRELGLDTKYIVIGYVGRFSPEKNLRTLLLSFEKISAYEPYVRLVLVGEGSSELELKNLVAERRLQEKVIFCGVRYDINRILASLDIFVLPSYTEGLSYSLIEAMACGRAVICSDIPGNRELVNHYQEGLLVDPNDVKDLQNAIKILSEDQSLRSRLGDNAKSRVCRYDEDLVFPSILQYYENVLQEKGKYNK